VLAIAIAAIALVAGVSAGIALATCEVPTDPGAEPSSPTSLPAASDAGASKPTALVPDAAAPKPPTASPLVPPPPPKKPTHAPH
jgi:hypothetical protein